MREVAPGDLILSLVDTRIAALAIAASYCYESPKPAEFGTAGLNWEVIVGEFAFSSSDSTTRSGSMITSLCSGHCCLFTRCNRLVLFGTSSLSSGECVK
jgi:hypothetical protein